MKELIYIFIGGGTGSVLRFMVSAIYQHFSLHPRMQEVVFPWATFIVNIIGCFLIGLFYKYSERWDLSPEMRLLLTTGLCGGFTTFSTFSYEGIALLNGGYYFTYFLYLTLSIILGLAAVATTFLINNA